MLLGLYLADLFIWPGTESFVMNAGGSESPGGAALVKESSQQRWPVSLCNNSHSCVITYFSPAQLGAVWWPRNLEEPHWGLVVNSQGEGY